MPGWTVRGGCGGATWTGVKKPVQDLQVTPAKDLPPLLCFSFLCSALLVPSNTKNEMYGFYSFPVMALRGLSLLC